MLENYHELDIEVRGRSEHCIDLIFEMRKELVYFPSIMCEVDISATKVWIVSLEGQLFTIKDSWIQDKHVQSEVSFLAQMSILKLEGHVPHLVCGGDIIINGAKDCTGHYCVDLEGYPYSQHVHHCIITLFIGQSLTTFWSKQEFINITFSLPESRLSYLYLIFTVELMILSCSS
jgi:hypothetical protein